MSSERMRRVVVEAYQRGCRAAVGDEILSRDELFELGSLLITGVIARFEKRWSREHGGEPQSAESRRYWQAKQRLHSDRLEFYRQVRTGAYGGDRERMRTDFEDLLNRYDQITQIRLLDLRDSGG